MKTIKMNVCPQCKGKKEITCTVHESGKKDTEFTMPCVTCKGKGELTDAEYRAEIKFRKSWCQCGNKSKEVRFYDDYEHPDCSKHHYRCGDCGKILQIG